jgi:hypothetical protein
MMGFIKIFSKPHEIKRFLRACDEIDIELLKSFSSVRTVLKNRVRAEAAIAENSSVIVQLIKDGYEPKITAYLFIRVVLEDLLLDGEYHDLQGTLSQDGACFLALYNNIIRELRVLNWFSAVQADYYFEDIRSNLDAMSREGQPSEAPVEN